jgi:hypothetical protein
MTDEDWIAGRQIGYTESPAQLELLHATAEVVYALGPGSRMPLSALLRMDYQHIEQHLVGYSGWRRSLFSNEVVSVSGTAPVIDYRVTYLTPQLGARLAVARGAHLRASVQGGAGIAFAWDEDDHLLRSRLSEGSGVGIASHLRLALDVLPGFVPWKWLHGGLGGELRYFRAEGSATQTWYRDAELPAGTVIDDIPYRIESLQYSVTVGAGAAF